MDAGIAFLFKGERLGRSEGRLDEKIETCSGEYKSAMAPIVSCWSDIKDFQLESLVAYPKEAKMLAQEQIARRLNISPKAVFCAAEVLTNDARKLMNNVWGIKPFNVYASTETAGIASECTMHNLHMYEDLVIIEVVDKDNKPVKPGEYGFKLLATVLFSRTLPLIRYEISDSVLLSSRECTCGLPFALMEDIQGRA